MTDIEVALELMKILLPARSSLSHESREDLLALYRKCLATVRAAQQQAPE
ncbi:MAG: hypothetical protein IJT88_01115 [Kiritimatiellae bacterium]|nr:hypothetical protein [Kiritimatiellia bacterium]